VLLSHVRISGRVFTKLSELGEAARDLKRQRFSAIARYPIVPTCSSRQGADAERGKPRLNELIIVE
jgi:hypothetical protein